RLTDLLRGERPRQVPGVNDARRGRLAGVAGPPAVPALALERPEPHERDALPLGHGIPDDLDRRIDRAADIRLARAGPLGDLRDEAVLVHGIRPSPRPMIAT